MRLIAFGTLAAALILAAAGQARRAAGQSLAVTFSPSGTITVTLPDGTPVGTASGAPTVIPAGYYIVLLAGPGGCTYLPLFELKGPGVDLFDDMSGGELNYDSRNAYLQPNATYTWRNFGTPSVVYSFATSATIQGSPPVAGSPVPSSSHSTVSSQDVVGSGVAPLRGRLTGVVSAAGRLTLARGGKSITGLKAGRYAITVSDRSSSDGFMLKGKSRTVTVTSAAFLGKRSVTIRLTAGRWIVTPRPGAVTFSILVS